MRRREHGRSSARRVFDRLRVSRRANFVRRQHIRRHGAQEPGKRFRLGNAANHVCTRPYVQPRHALADGGELVPLIGQSHGEAAQGELAHRVAEHGRLPAARRRQEDPAARVSVRHQPTHHIGRTARAGSGDAYT